MIISGSVNIVANLILIPAFHAMGAALTTILSELVISIGSTILAYKILRKLFLKQYLLIIIITVFSCLLGFIIQFLKINPFIAAFVFLFTFVVIIFAFKIVSLTEIRGYLKK